MNVNLSSIRIFIFSSFSSWESRYIANNLSVFLEEENFHVKIWNDEFQNNPFEAIMRDVMLADYGIVLANFDEDMKRGRRDRILFGIGIGILGIKKLFSLFIIDNRNEQDKQVSFPPDYFGIKSLYITRIDDHEKFNQELKNNCNQIKKHIIQIENSINRIQIGTSLSELLAVNYFNEFLNPLYTELIGNNILKIEGQEFNPNRDKFEIIIIFPNNLDNVLGVYSLLKERFMRTGIQTSKFPRGIPIYIDFEHNTNIFKFYDYPSTLILLKKTIERLIKNDCYTDEQIRWLKYREIRNFHRTLEILMKEEGREYGDKIKFISAEEFNEK